MADSEQATGRNRPHGPSSTTSVVRERLGVILWRRKWVVLGTALILTALTAVVSKSLPKEYEATATLWVTEDSGTAAFDAVQAGEVLARTYGQVADSPNVAARVATSLPFEASAGDVLNEMKFEPVSETQLLRITAANGDPERARVIANAYAREFIAYSRSQLGDAVNARVAFADAASTPTQPARPQPTLYTVAGALLGLAIGVGMALLAEAVDRRVRSTDEVEELAGAPVLAQIPRRAGDPETETAFEETFRLLQTNLQFLKRDGGPPRSIVVVSPSIGDGKSTVSYNLARSLAEAGTEVVLIEADMRRPGLRRSVLRPRPGEDRANGLSNYLNRRVTLDEVLTQTDLPRLRFIPAGMLPPTPSTLVNAERAQVLLEEARSLAEVVIVDTPPLSVGAEAATLAASADGALMVVNPRISTKPDIRRARQRLAVVKAGLLGVVLNEIRNLSDVGADVYKYRQDEPRNKPGARRPRMRV